MPGSHPYLQKELLRKIYGSVTTRSNVFAVWATVGFFEVDDSVSPPRIGAEIGASENRQIRHRMFSIIDRTQLQMWPTLVKGTTTPTVFSPAVSVTPATGPPTTISLSSTTFTRADAVTPVGGTAYQWQLQPGAILVYDPNTDNEETVVAQGPPGGPYTATFRNTHTIQPGMVGVPVVVRGNPGPLLRYDPRQDKDVVPYFGLID